MILASEKRVLGGSLAARGSEVPAPARLAPVFLLILAVVLTGALSGCAVQDDPTRVSTIPFNRPERWEGQGPMGGMMPQSR